MWILAPQRDGPHNWEDVGLRSILRAIEILAQQVRMETASNGSVVRADANRSSVFFFGEKGGGRFA